MKRITLFLAIITGIIAVLVWAAPIGAENIHDMPHQSKHVIFYSQLLCAPFPEDPPCEEDCGGEVTVFYQKGQAYVVFDFMTPFPNEKYYLYMGRNQMAWFGVPIGEVTTDDDGECHSEPISFDMELVYPDLVGIDMGAAIQVSFDVYSENHIMGGPPMYCGDWMSVGFWFEE